MNVLKPIFLFSVEFVDNAVNGKKKNARVPNKVLLESSVRSNTNHTINEMKGLSVRLNFMGTFTIAISYPIFC